MPGVRYNVSDCSAVYALARRVKFTDIVYCCYRASIVRNLRHGANPSRFPRILKYYNSNYNAAD